MKTLPPSRCRTLVSLMCAVLLLASGRGYAQPGEFLTREEVDAVRDAQEPEKRIPLYLEIAELRLGALRAAIATVKSGAGRAAQKKLVEYTRVMEALENTIDDARTKRSPFPKAMEQLKARLPEARNFLESLDNEDSPLYKDYQFTLAEAVDTTDDLIAEVERGMFPEVDEREAPKEFPAAPPPRTEQRPRPAAPAPGEEDGPPRKPGARQPAPAPPAEDGPPRKSNRQ
jgi:hypothetical protein